MATRKRSGALDAADRNAMRDSTYAFPRQRKEPLNDASHVRNAIARFDQVEDVTDDERREAFHRIQRAAKKFGVELTETSWRDLGGPGRKTSGSAKKATRGAAKMTTGSGGQSRDELYAEAKRRNIKGRSTMTKAQLQRALRG